MSIIESSRSIEALFKVREEFREACSEYSKQRITTNQSRGYSCFLNYYSAPSNLFISLSLAVVDVLLTES